MNREYEIIVDRSVIKAPTFILINREIFSRYYIVESVSAVGKGIPQNLQLRILDLSVTYIRSLLDSIIWYCLI